MSHGHSGALCVAIHDVAPATWHLCVRLREMVREVAPNAPVTLLVVPHYHDDPAAPPQYLEWLRACVAQGDETALHGYTHRDPAPRGWLRRRYTAGEGEFAALSHAEAVRRIARGRLWFAAHGLPLSGFIAPAWLLGEGAWQALREFDFAYTTTLTAIHDLQRGRTLRAPTLAYSTRTAARRVCSLWWNSALLRLAARVPVLRIGLHPADAAHPQVFAHAAAMLRRLQRDREPVVKRALFAAGASPMTTSWSAPLC